MLIGIGAPLNAMKIDADGGCTMMSAPTPSVRFADSKISPLVSPTTIITSITSTATAITVIAVRTGRCIALRRIRWPIKVWSPAPARSSPTRSSCVPGGCFNTNRSAAIVFVRRQLGDPNIKTIIVRRPFQGNLARVSYAAKHVPVAVAHVGDELASGIVGLDARDVQVGAIEPDLARNIPILRAPAAGRLAPQSAHKTATFASALLLDAEPAHPPESRSRKPH